MWLHEEDHDSDPLSVDGTIKLAASGSGGGPACKTYNGTVAVQVSDVLAARSDRRRTRSTFQDLTSGSHLAPRAGCLSVCSGVVLFSSRSARAGPAYAQSLPAGWSSTDIGAVGAAGSATGSGGSFTVTGAGADIWGSADAFRFVYTTLTGDGSIVADVTAEQYVANWTKAGVMMRETLTAGSRQALMLVSPGKGLAFQRRVDPDGVSTSTPGAAAAAPYFVKLTRAGDDVHRVQLPRRRQLDDGRIRDDRDGIDDLRRPGREQSCGRNARERDLRIHRGHGVGSDRDHAERWCSCGMERSRPGGYGQLTCQGLQRALALPPVLTNLYGSPQYVFAPDPAAQVPDAAGSFYYVRPLATIEPTAIRLRVAREHAVRLLRHRRAADHAPQRPRMFRPRSSSRGSTCRRSRSCRTS